MKIGIIGQGYVGLTISAVASAHFKVIGFDNNNIVVDNLNKGISHIEGVENSALLIALENESYKATSNQSDLSGCDVIIIAVPTPLTGNRKPDLRYIEAACKTIGQSITHPILVINESTSYPGTLRNLIKPMIEKYSNAPIDHRYAISPERVDPGRKNFDLKNTPRLYAGLTAPAAEETLSFYSKFCTNLVEVSTPEVAEAAKLFENTFRQVNIALANEFAQICYALGISVHETLDAAGTKPYGFMKFSPSAGVGGHCIPVDPTYLATKAEELGAPATFIRHANEVNSGMARYVVDRVIHDNSGTISGKRILLVGVAYKPNVSDVRETAADSIMKHCLSHGAFVSWHDNLVKIWNGETSSNLQDADISIVVTKHDSVSDEMIKASAPYVFDTTGSVKGVVQF